jgi:hypothetical protein
MDKCHAIRVLDAISSSPVSLCAPVNNPAGQKWAPSCCSSCCSFKASEPRTQEESMGTAQCAQSLYNQGAYSICMRHHPPASFGALHTNADTCYISVWVCMSLHQGQVAQQLPAGCLSCRMYPVSNRWCYLPLHHVIAPRGPTGGAQLWSAMADVPPALINGFRLRH